MERLAAQDLSMVLPEGFGWPQDLGALGILAGAGGVAAFGAFLDLSADAQAPPPPPWTPTRLPSGRELLRDNLHRRVHGLQGFLSGLAHPAGTVRGIRHTWPAAREMFAEGRA